MKKKFVFKYLDIMFNGQEIVDKKIKINGRSVLAFTNDRRRGNEQIHFSHNEFWLITKMFDLSPGESSDYIKEYLSIKFNRPEIINFPFHPYL